jgi:N-acylneuraminate cytidylyltransferase
VSAYVVVPARGGSKGIVDKNLQTVGGVSLVERCVSTALRAQTVDLVVVSTDDPAIAAAARRAGARVVERPSDLSGDAAASESAVLHALDALPGDDPDVTVLVQCTSPFTSPDDIDAAVAAVAAGADSVFTASRTHAFVWRAGDDGVSGVNHDGTTRAQGQARPPEYLENGAVYAMRTAGLRASAHRFFGRIEVVDVPASRSLQIHDADDLERARLLEPALAALGRRAPLPRRVAGLALDFDGVLTDNGVLTTEDGVEAVRSDRSDSLGLELLRLAGLPIAVLSKEKSSVVAARCEKLQLECVQGLDDKLGAFAGWMDRLGLDPAEVVFVGNDANDVECLVAAGCGVVVGDAHASALAVADVVLSRPGGRGAVRELADLIIDRVRSA